MSKVGSNGELSFKITLLIASRLKPSVVEPLRHSLWRQVGYVSMHSSDGEPHVGPVLLLVVLTICKVRVLLDCVSSDDVKSYALTGQARGCGESRDILYPISMKCGPS